MFYDFMDSELGFFKVSATNLGICRIEKVDKIESQPLPNPITNTCIKQLNEYFDQKRTNFDVSLDISQGTDFYKKVWIEVCKVAYGTTKSYMDIAKILNNTGAIRAVGMANGKNPIPIIIPCHRIIGSDGSLTGYSGGLPMKKYLLHLENPETFGIQQELFA